MTRRGRGRPPGDSGAREAILDEARRQFGAQGYRGTTLRSVATTVGVDPRLVLHYFGSKEELFKASVELPMEPEALAEVILRDGIDRIGVNVATVLIEVLEDPGRRQPMLALVRAAITEPEAATLIREVLVGRLLGPIASRVGGDEPELRAGLVATHVVGLAVVRHVVGLPSMADAAPERLVAILAPVIQGYFTDPLPAVGPAPSGTTTARPAAGSDPHILAPGTLPTPFTADEIRAGCPDGRLIRMRIEAGGRTVGFRTTRYRDGDAEGVTAESQAFDADGAPTVAVESERSTWQELQAHASFPADRTSREPVALDTPLGRLDCLHYQRSNLDGSTSDFWFARSAPGMPVRFRTVKGRRVTSEVVVIEDRIQGM